MERLTIRIDGEAYIEKVANKYCEDVCSSRNRCNDCPIRDAFNKLAHYEDLEERIEKLFDGKISLNEAVEEIEKKVHGEEVFRYSRILTNAEAEKWDRWLGLEEQGYKMVNTDKVVEQLLKNAYKVTEKNTNLEHAVIGLIDVIKIVKGGAK